LTGCSFVVEYNWKFCVNFSYYKAIHIDVKSTQRPNDFWLEMLNTKKTIKKDEENRSSSSCDLVSRAAREREISSWVKEEEKAQQWENELASERYKYVLNFLLWMGRFLLNGLPISLIYRHLRQWAAFFVVSWFLLHHTFFINSSFWNLISFPLKYSVVKMFFFFLV
jgi:hypothetical protein